MAVKATSATSCRLDVGDTWLLGVLVTSDSTGYAVTADVSVEVTDPEGTATEPEAESEVRGYYTAEVVVDAEGRWVAEVAVDGHGVVAFHAEAGDTVAEAGMPDLAGLKAYLGDVAGQWSDGLLSGALAAERAAQAAVCRVGPLYPPDLAEALYRRVQRNLALRALPLAVLQGDAEAGSTVLPGRDPEVRRLEAPHRKVVVG